MQSKGEDTAHSILVSNTDETEDVNGCFSAGSQGAAPAAPAGHRQLFWQPRVAPKYRVRDSFMTSLLALTNHI